MRNFFKGQWVVVVSILFTGCILVGSFLWFSKGTASMLGNLTETYLVENAKSQAAAFYTKLDDQMELLHSDLAYFENVNEANERYLLDRVFQIRSVGAFKSICVANKSGEARDYEGFLLGNIAHTDYFKGAMNGETVISRSTYVDPDGEEVLVLAIPIQNVERKIIGVLYGTFARENLSELIREVSFTGNSTNLLLSSEGIILARSEGTSFVDDSVRSFYNIGTSWGEKGELSIFDVRKFLELDDTLYVSYRNEDREMFVIIAPVGVHDWKYAIVVPKSIVDNETKIITNKVLIVELCCTIAFVILLFSILYLVKRNERMIRSNENYRLASNTSKTVLFEYDMLKKKLVLEGTENLLFDGDKSEFHGDDLLRFIDRIHEDEKKVKEEIQELIKGTSDSIDTEFRVSCLDNCFHWFRLSGSMVKDNDGKLLRFVGNITNVEDQVNKEQELREKAELDTLTGIFNNGSFREHVAAALENMTENSVCALFIMDLDNFKNVNDSLGHIKGDKVLTDTATKLCKVFSERDIVGRIGGDEFAAFMCLEGKNMAECRRIIEDKAKSVCNALRASYGGSNRFVRVSSSVGIAIGTDAEKKFMDLYKRADKVLYLSKDGGRDRYTISEE